MCEVEGVPCCPFATLFYPTLTVFGGFVRAAQMLTHHLLDEPCRKGRNHQGVCWYPPRKIDLDPRILSFIDYDRLTDEEETELNRLLLLYEEK